MALRVEELSGPRNTGLLQTLNKSFDWKRINNAPQDPMAKLTRKEAQILKNERSETYNGPYRLEADDTHLEPASTKEPFKLTIINNPDSLIKSDIIKPILKDVSKLPESEVIFSNKAERVRALEEARISAQYFSNGDRF